MLLLIAVILTIINSIPVAFFGMLFLGNLGTDLGFLDIFPGAVALNILKNSLVSYKVKK